MSVIIALLTDGKSCNCNCNCDCDCNYENLIKLIFFDDIIQVLSRFVIFTLFYLAIVWLFLMGLIILGAQFYFYVFLFRKM